MSVEIPSRNNTLRTPQMVVFLALCFAFLYLRTFLLSGTPLAPSGDSILRFVNGTRILHGELPVRDFFIYLVPGADLFYTTCFRLFGVHMVLVQAFLIGIGFAIVCVLTWISRKILPDSTALLPALAFLVFDFNSALDATHHWYCTFLLLCAVAVLMQARSLPRIAAAGALCGLATAFTQTQGACGLVAVALYFVLTRRTKQSLAKELTCLCLPCFAIMALLLGYLAYKAGAHAVFYNVVYFPAKYFHASPNNPASYFLQVPPHRRFSDLALIFPYLLIHLLVPFAYIVCGCRLLRDRTTLPNPLRDHLLLLNLLGFAIFVAVLYGPTYHRLCTVAPPAFLIATWLIAEDARPQRTLRVAITTLAVFALILFPFRTQHHWHGRLNLPIGRTAFLDRAEYDRMAWLAARTHPGETFFPSSHLGLALGLNNPAPIEAVFPEESTQPDQVRSTINALEAHHTCFVFLYPESYLSQGAHDHLGPFRTYIAEHYSRVRSDNAGEFWQRNPPPPQADEHPNQVQENPCPSI